MSLRLRIFLGFALLVLLPVLPVTWAARDLLDKSFELGLSREVQAGLEAGADAARARLRAEVDRFRADLDAMAARRADLDALRSGAARLAEMDLPDGHWLVLDAGGAVRDSLGDWPAAERDSLAAAARTQLPAGGPAPGRPLLPRGGDRQRLGAVLPLGDPVAGWLLFGRSLDPAFLAGFGDIIVAQQLLAGLQIEKPRLRRGFVAPFLVVYAVLLVLSLLAAWLVSRRLTGRLRALGEGARRVGAGDWSARVPPGGRDEVGRLIAAFNEMASGLEDQRRRLGELERMAAWREMARGLAHEIKNPLTPISLVVQELRDRYPGGDEAYAAFLAESGRIVEEEIDSLRRLSREFSEFARAPEMKKMAGDLGELVADLARLYGRVPVTIDWDPALPVFAFDPEQMRRVLANLFENALAALESVPEAERAIRLVARREEDEAVIEFSDTGPGIPEDIRDRIFEPHFTTKGSGMGLGLALVRSVLTLHGGEVDVAPGPGAPFTIRLPLEESA